MHELGDFFIGDFFVAASVIGTIIGVFIMSVLKIGLPYIDLQPHYQLFITGFVVIVAVYFDIFIRKNKKK